MKASEFILDTIDNISSWSSVNSNSTLELRMNYLVDTSSSPLTLTIPIASKLGDQIILRDQSNSFSTNNVTLTSTDRITGSTSDFVLDVDGSTTILIYIDADYGWQVIENRADVISNIEIDESGIDNGYILKYNQALNKFEYKERRPLSIAPVLSGVSSALELTNVIITITNYDAGGTTYDVSVPAGSFDRVGDTITWTLPDISSPVTYEISVTATQSGGYIGNTTRHSVYVMQVVVDGDIVYNNEDIEDLPAGWEGKKFVYGVGEDQELADSDFYQARVITDVVNSEEYEIVPDDPLMYTGDNQNLGDLFIDGETTIEDENGNHTISAIGNTVISTTEKKIGTSSIYFDGNGDYLSIPDSDDWDFGSGDFTIDFWVKLTNGAAITRFFGKGWNTGSLSFFLYTNGSTMYFYHSTDGTNNIYPTCPYTYESGVWTHTVISRHNNKLLFFKDGILQATQPTITADIYDSANPLIIGCDGNMGSNFVNGYIDQFRITKGKALWTENFDVEILPKYSTTSNLLLNYPTSGALSNGDTIISGKDSTATLHTVGNVVSIEEHALKPVINKQEIATIGGIDWTHFEIGSDHYLAVTNFYNGSTRNINSKIYKWNGSSFDEFQNIATNGAFDFEHFIIGSDHYLAVANYNNNSTHNINSKIYKWNGSSFDEFQSIATNGAGNWTHFEIGTDHYLAVANYYNGSTYNLNSKIYKWNGVDEFELFQSIATNGSIDFEHFMINTNHYLAVANHYNGSTRNINSKIYKWNGSSFAEFQSIATNGAHDFEHFMIDTNHYLAVANNYNGSTYNINSKIYRISDFQYDLSNLTPSLSATYGDLPDNVYVDDNTMYLSKGTTLEDIDAKVLDDVHKGDFDLSEYNLFIDGETVIEDETGNHTITAVGDTVISTTEKKIGASSIYFDGAGDVLVLPPSTDWDLSNDDFTIDGWVYPTIFNNGFMFSFPRSSTNYATLQISMASGKFTMFGTYAGTAWDILEYGNIPFTVSAWNHVAVVRNGTSLTLYVNGVADKIKNVSTSSLYYRAVEFTIGGYKAYGTGAITSPMDGYIDQFRFVKGKALWTGNYFNIDNLYDSIDHDVIGTYPTSGAITTSDKLLIDGIENIVDTVTEEQVEVSNEGFGIVTYTGDGTTNREITGVGFKPDMVWIKNRSDSTNHKIYDSIRGGLNEIYPNLTNEEGLNSDALQSFNTDGFVVDDDITVNGSGDNFVAWCWKADKYGYDNNDYGLSQEEKYSLDSGLSIIRYTGNNTTGRKVKHALGAKPKMILIKNLGTTDVWIVYNEEIGATKYLVLNTTAATATSSNVFNDTEPTDEYITFGTSDAVNELNNEYIAYVFTDVEGVSDFGSYTGNGSTTGPIVDCGFEPAYVMIKRTDAVGYWDIFDSKRGGNKVLFADESLVEATDDHTIEFLSNGFQPTDTSASINSNGGDYIYMAFKDSKEVTKYLIDTDTEVTEEPTTCASIPKYDSVDLASVSNYSAPKFNEDFEISDPSTFTNDDCMSGAVCKLSDNKIAVVYQDVSASDGIIIIGNVNDDKSITWGDKYVFNTNARHVMDICKLSDNKVFILWTNETSKVLYSIVGFISGTEVSFGTSFQIDDSECAINRNTLSRIDDNHIALAYRDYGNSGAGKMVVCNVDENNIITRGSKYTFNDGYTGSINLLSLNPYKFCITYRANDENYDGKSRIALVNMGDLSISYGTESRITTRHLYNGFLININKDRVVINYRDTDTSTYYIQIGEVTGTDIDWKGEQYLTDDIGNIFSLIEVSDNYFGLAMNGVLKFGTVNDSNVITWSSDKPLIGYGLNYYDFCKLDDDNIVGVFCKNTVEDNGVANIISTVPKEFTQTSEIVTLPADIRQLGAGVDLNTNEKVKNTRINTWKVE